MDIYTFIVMLHVIGTILGTGGATIAELQITRALKDKQVSPDERALMHVNYGLIRVGMGLLLVSVIGMYWYFSMTGSDILFTSEKLWIKDVMFVMIFLNALALQKRWVPLWLGASVSFTSWWGATLLGLAGQLPYSFTTYLIGYVVAIFVVASLLHSLRAVVAAGSLSGLRLQLTVGTTLLVLLMGIYLMIGSERTARQDAEEATAIAPAAETRTLTETVSFEYPGGSHTINFAVQVDDTGVIRNIAGADIEPENQGRIADFVATVNEQLVGEALASVIPLSRVGGASLTTEAFNEAVALMQENLAELSES